MQSGGILWIKKLPQEQNFVRERQMVFAGNCITGGNSKYASVGTETRE